ncbi:MAG: hypothetical protein LBR72_06085 [Oscillospiraceae bacterium]|jgi:hypothetical protein|nr:hypothetical protein [Oscillospiraceae bacterium]
MKYDGLEFCYRLGLRPNADTGEITEAVRFALDAGMTDICLFLNAEELNTGYFDGDELTGLIKTAQKLKEAMSGTGLTLSVNPWNTLLHGDRGRKLKPGQNFWTMVDVNGKAADAVACPLCENWRAWLLSSYARIAGELKPHILWVEDDFRLHNHEGLEWGGCFCQAHMEEYSGRVGETVDREMFLERVTSVKPNKYREAWLTTHRETMNELASLLEGAVSAVSPDTKLALMSSAPKNHCAEGRDWHGILNSLGGKHAPINRIHLPAYAEMWAAEYMRGFVEVSLCVRAMCPPATRVLPELENYPYSLFIKSRAFTRFQIESAAPLNLAGMTLNLFDVMGGNQLRSEKFQDVLPETFEYLGRLSASGAFGGTRAGVCIPVSGKASYHLHTDGRRDLTGLYPKETFLGGLLATFGVPVYCLAGEIPSGAVAAVSGQWLRNLSQDEIVRFFAENRVILDGEAAETLFSLGLGHLAGIEAAEWHKQDSGVANYEKAETSYLGLPEPVCSSQVMAGDYLRVTYTDAEILSTVYNWRREVSGPGMAVANGNVLIFPYGRFGELTRKHFHPVRQSLFQDGLRKLGAELFLEGSRNVFPFARGMRDGRTALYLVNAALDGTEELTLYTAGRKIKDIQILRCGGEDNTLTLNALECALVLIRWEESE